MRLFSKEEIISLRNHVNSVNNQYNKKTYDKDENIEISNEKVKALNNLNRIMSSKYK